MFMFVYVEGSLRPHTSRPWGYVLLLINVPRSLCFALIIASELQWSTYGS